MNVEPFVYLSLFLFFALVVFLVRWLKGEIEKSVELEGKPKVLGWLEERAAPLGAPVDRHRPGELRIRTEPSLPLVKSRGIPGKVKVQPRNLREMRQGIVLMTVLGPCRAVQPPDKSLHY